MEAWERGLTVKNLGFSYETLLEKNLFSLDAISFRIEPGFIYGLVGRNGSGKTTLIQRIMKGDYEKGHVCLDGVSMENNPVKVKEELGIISYPAILLEKETARKNGEILGTLYSSWNQQAYIDKLAEFQVEADAALNCMSKGEIMKVQVAFAWGHRPGILIADEPAAGFDPVFRKEFREFMQEYVEDGEHSVFLSTHITKDLEAVADYIMILHQGKMVCQGSMEELRDQYGADSFTVSGLLREKGT